MIATFAIETGLGIYVALKYPSSLFRSIVITILLCLASFQLAEFQVCTGSEAEKLVWTRFGLVGITLLPALGMHLLGVVTRKSFFIPLGYAIAACYALGFALIPGTTAQADCCGNYVLLNITNSWVGILYDLYYTIFILLAMLDLGLRLARKEGSSESGYSKKLVTWTLVAYLSFTLPMAIVAIVASQLRNATPSIMCGFAVLLALILALKLAPMYARETEAMKKLEDLTPDLAV